MNKKIITQFNQAINIVLRELEDITIEINECRFKVSNSINNLKFVLLELEKQLKQLEGDNNGKE